MSSLTNFHHNESLVWFKTSQFCYTINIESSLVLLQVILLLYCVMDPEALGRPNLKPWIWAWVLPVLIKQQDLPYLSH